MVHMSESVLQGFQNQSEISTIWNTERQPKQLKSCLKQFRKEEIRKRGQEGIRKVGEGATERGKWEKGKGGRGRGKGEEEMTSLIFDSLFLHQNKTTSTLECLTHFNSKNISFASCRYFGALQCHILFWLDYVSPKSTNHGSMPGGRSKPKLYKPPTSLKPYSLANSATIRIRPLFFMISGSQK